MREKEGGGVGRGRGGWRGEKKREQSARGRREKGEEARNGGGGHSKRRGEERERGGVNKMIEAERWENGSYLMKGGVHRGGGWAKEEGRSVLERAVGRRMERGGSGMGINDELVVTRKIQVGDRGVGLIWDEEEGDCDGRSRSWKEEEAGEWQRVVLAE